MGAKTITAILVVGATFGVALWTGVLSLERLGDLGAISPFVIGTFSALVGTFGYRYWRFNERSETSVRVAWKRRGVPAELLGIGPISIEVADGQGGAFELPPFAHHIAWVTVVFIAGMAAVDGGTLEYLRTLPNRVDVLGSRVCQAPGREVATEQTSKPGCELVRRAYELGFADDLGPCAPEATVAAEQRACSLRQYDEPALHYAWRLLQGALVSLSAVATPGRITESVEKTKGSVEHLATVLSARRYSLGALPRASHHVFTNLPSPHDALQGAAGGALTRVQCLDRNHMLPHRPVPDASPDLRSSLETQHIVGQLLFDTRYESAAAFCREHTIHWDSPLDACARLAEAPAAFLGRMGAWQEVRDVLNRFEVNVAYEHFAAEQSGDETRLAAADALRWVFADRYVGFRCYFESVGAASSRLSHSVDIDGHLFEAHEVTVGAPEGGMALVERYAHVAPLLATGFHYDAIASSSGVGGSYVAGDSPRRFLQGSDGFLTKLDYLTDIDIFLGHGWWVPHSEDLMQIYPYHVHVRNFVEMFREQYRLEYSRL